MLRKWSYIRSLGGLSIGTLEADRQDPNLLHTVLGNTHFVSPDTGVNWQTTSDHRAFYYPDPLQPRTYYARLDNMQPPDGSVRAGTGPVYKSTDGGRAWQGILAGSLCCKLAVPPAGSGVPSVVFAVYTNGAPSFTPIVVRSLDGGTTWLEVQFPSFFPWQKNNITALAFDTSKSVTYAASS